MAERAVADKLCSASARGKLLDVKTFLENGTDVNGFNRHERTALQVVMLGCTDVIKALLVAGADPNIPDPACGLTVLHDAAREGFVDSVRALVDHGADANLEDNKGNLPLHLAAREGRLEVIQLLLDRTGNPQKANNEGFTAWQLAVQYKRMDTAKCIDEHLSSQ